jgi:AcrR family transcriptional regulator
MPSSAEAVVPIAARERILDVALSLFASHGFEGASTREVALAAGVQQGLVGYHFGSKEGLWRAVVDAGFARLGAAAQAREPITALEPRLRLRLRLERALELAVDEPLLLRLAGHAMLCGGSRFAWLVEQHLRPLQDALRRVLAGVPGGGPAPGVLERQLVGWLAAQVALEPFVVPLTLQASLDAWLAGAGRVSGGAWSVDAAQRRALEREQAGR